jgi:hypothetical protein
MTGPEAGLAGALALTAHYFPREHEGKPVAGLVEATFFAHRKPQAWSRWATLSPQERDVMRQVMWLMPAYLADPGRLAEATMRLTGAASADGLDRSGGAFRPIDGPAVASGVIVRVGGDFLGYAKRTTDRFFTFGQTRRAQAFAGPGFFQTRTTYHHEEGTTSREIVFEAAPGFDQPVGHEALPRLTTRPARDRVTPTVEELKQIAKELSTRKGCDWLEERLELFLDGLKTSDGDDLAEFDLTAGDLQTLNAPTGSGKSVLVRIMASWGAMNGVRTGIVVSDVRTTMELAAEINADLAHLHKQGKLPEVARCTPLMSPAKMHERALDHAALTPPSASRPWDPATVKDLAILGSGCAQRPLMDPADLFKPGDENCTTLTSAATGSNWLACPFIPVCGKFEQLYEAVDAAVIVTNHHNLLDGSTRIGIVLDEQAHNGTARGTAGVSVLEFILRACDVLLVDEVDAFQSTAIASCTSELVLASRKRTSVPRAIDDDTHKLPSVHKRAMTPPITHTRFIAEMLLEWIGEDGLRLNPGNEAKSPDGASRDNAGWRMARSRDRELAQLLFPDQATLDDVPPELFDLLDQLSPTSWSADHESPLFPDDDVDWSEIKESLENLLGSRGEDHLAVVRAQMRTILADRIPDPQKLAAVVNLLVTRAVLEELDRVLDRVRDEAQAMRYLDRASVHKILESMRDKTVTRFYPTAMLGRAVRGYQVKGMEKKDSDAELASQAFGGDPHTLVAELGGLTALFAAGVQRPVMGLSATAYLPQAVQEHIHAPVRWWIPDDHPNSIKTRATLVQSAAGEAMRIGGLPQHLKPEALNDLGKALYEQHLARRLAKLAQSPRTASRARVILAVNSYEQAAHLAAGVGRADGLDHGIWVLARKRGQQPDYERTLPPTIQKIYRAELKDFPNRGEILIAPLSVIARGLNIVVETRSAVSEIYLCVRPVLSIEDIPWMHASVNAAGRKALPVGGSDTPVAAIRAAREASWAQLRQILRSPAELSNMNHDLRKELVASMLNLLIQLAGRARRGGTDMTLHLVDQAMHDSKFSSDLATVIREIHDDWTPEQRDMMNELYGEALQSFLSYAGIDRDTF